MEKFGTSRKARIWASLGVMLGLVIMAIVRSASNDAAPTAVAVPEPSAEEIVNHHLAWADSQGQGDLTDTAAPIRTVFAEARLGSRRFAEQALSLTSKWKLLSDFVTNGDDHKAFLEEQFAAHVFSPEALESVVQSVVAGHVQRLDDIDSELLVRLQADLADVPNLQLSANVDRQAIQRSLEASIRQAIDAVAADLGPGAGLELVSWIAGEALTSATLRLGASTGILGAGAASGTMSFGVGLVVGFIVDYVVSWVYDEIFDPAGELSRQINATLDALEQQILTGDADGPGLIQRLQDYSARRSMARNAAIRELVVKSAINAATY